MSGSRAYQKRTGPGRCPACGKKGLGTIYTSVAHGRGVSYRVCRYCGDQFDVPLRDVARDSREAELAKAIEHRRAAEARDRIYKLIVMR